MNKGSASTVIAGFLLLAAAGAGAQTMQAVAGIYTITKIDPTSYGENPRGLMILTPDGHYSINLAAATLPKFAANNRLKGTPAENEAVVRGSLFHYGTYTIDDGGKYITFNIQASTFPNFDGTVQKRALTYKDGELTYVPTTASAGTPPSPVIWKKIN
jgi:hypothetical protein